MNATRRSLVAGLLASQALLLAYADYTMSPNQTEIGHIGATVYFWKAFRFDVFHVNPPLTRIITGMPIYFCRPHFDGQSYSPDPNDRCEWALGREFLHNNSRAMIHWSFAAARWMCIPLLLAGGYAGYRVTSAIYGDSSSVVFLCLWCFCPFIQAWGATMCPDSVAAALGMIGINSFHESLRRPRCAHFVMSGLCLGLLTLSKMTWLIAFGLWPLIWFIRVLAGKVANDCKSARSCPSFLQLLTILLVGLFVFNLGYLFDGSFRPLGRFRFASSLLAGQSGAEKVPAARNGNRFRGQWLSALPTPLPAECVQGIDTQLAEFDRGGPSYLRGEWSDRGWWYFYLYVLAVKMPMGTWVLIITTAIVSCVRRSYNADWSDEIVVLVPCAGLFLVVSSQVGFSVHPRYIVPALPFLFVWVSKTGRAFALGHSLTGGLTLVSLVSVIASSLSVYPHNLSYFNEMAGGPKNGPRHLLGSNVDWGQELFTLEDWCREHPDAGPMRMAYWGTFPLEMTQIKSVGSPPIGPNSVLQSANKMSRSELGPQPGWYAMSVNEIYSNTGQFRYFREFEPVAMAGYAMYIYHITVDQANQVRRKIGLPEVSPTKAEMTSD